MDHAALAASFAGPEGAPGIVLVHGTRLAGASWHAQVVDLARDHRVLAVDLPGHGARRGEPFTHREAVDTILRAAAACPGGEAVLVGHSLGGFLVMDAAAEAPARCRGLVLAGCTALARGAATLPYRLALLALPLLSPARLAAWNDRLFRRLYSPEVIGPQLAAGYGFEAIPAAWGSVLGRDHARALAAFPGPVLCVNGARDLLFRRGERRFLRACPSARLEIVEGAGHLVTLDRPAEFTARVRALAAEAFRRRAAS